MQQDAHPALDELVAELLSTAAFFQTRARKLGSAPGSGERWLVVGMREVQSQCRRGRLQLIVVAANVRCDDAEEEAGVASTLGAIAAAAHAGGTPLLFALTRKRMSAALGLRASVTVVGLRSLEGLRELHACAVALGATLRRNWRHCERGEALEEVGGELAAGAGAGAGGVGASAPSAGADAEDGGSRLRACAVPFTPMPTA